MKKLKSNLAAKIVAMILVIVSAAAFAVSAAGIVVMESGGMYREKKEDILKLAYEHACYNYSIVALAGYEDDFNRQELERTNFRYGIVKADDIDKVDLSDRENYVACYMDEIPDREQLYIFGSDVASAWYSWGSNLWDPFYEVTDEDDVYDTVEYPIEGYYYNISDGDIYLKSGKQLFRLENDGMHWVFYGEDMDEAWHLNADLLDTVSDEDGEIRTVWDEAYRNAMVELEGEGRVPLDEFQIVDDEGIQKLGGITGGSISYISDGSVYVLEVQERKTENYFVVSCRQPSFMQWQENFLDADMFQQANMLVVFIYRVRYAAIGILILSVLVFAASFVFLLSAAGHQKGHEGICPRFLDRAPLDLYLSCVCVVDTLLAAVAVWGMEMIVWSHRQNVSTVWYVLAGLAVVCTGALAIAIAVLYCMSFAVNVKQGKWWRRTFIYWCCKKCIQAIRSLVHGCAYVVSGLWKSMVLLWKAWLLLGMIAFVEFIAILSVGYYNSPLPFFWFIEKIVLYPVIIVLLLQMDKLQKGAQRIAAGELSYQIDTSRMVWEMKKHGGYLNDIGVGMNHAVNERMKSERFKTELITNVSHDIKTPLTSIINYVDLLQKEEIQNPKVQDYLEVLHRQSARLKKLIEDLMEASKASTGNLTMVMEQCDAGVMLVQTVGEFEEKLMENQIELQVKKPEESLFINADSRHLWRVFDNMMNNICKYAQPMTRAYVNLEQDGHQAKVIFRNISKYQLNISSEELMERFVRGDSSRNTEGSGLGISIAKSLTELMGGTFELIVDGDLFKVILSFPLYDSGAVWQSSKNGMGSRDGLNGQAWQQSQGEDGADVGPQTGRFVSGMQNAGKHVKGMGQEAAKKTGRMFRWAGRLAHNVKQAVKQTKMEDEKDGADSESRHSGGSAE